VTILMGQESDAGFQKMMLNRTTRSSSNHTLHNKIEDQNKEVASFVVHRPVYLASSGRLVDPGFFSGFRHAVLNELEDRMWMARIGPGGSVKNWTVPKKAATDKYIEPVTEVALLAMFLTYLFGVFSLLFSILDTTMIYKRRKEHSTSC